MPRIQPDKAAPLPSRILGASHSYRVPNCQCLYQLYLAFRGVETRTACKSALLIHWSVAQDLGLIPAGRSDKESMAKSDPQEPAGVGRGRTATLQVRSFCACYLSSVSTCTVARLLCNAILHLSCRPQAASCPKQHPAPSSILPQASRIKFCGL